MPQGVDCNRGRTDASVPEPKTNLEAELPSPNPQGPLLQRLPLLHQRSRNTPRLSIPRYGSQTFTLITVRL